MKKIIISGFEYLNDSVINFNKHEKYDVLYSNPGFKNIFSQSLEKLKKNQSDLAKKNGYEYFFIDKNFISEFKNKYKKFNTNGIGVDGYADLARLFWIKEFIKQSYDEVVWFDCDLYFFDNFVFPKKEKKENLPIFGDNRIMHKLHSTDGIIMKEISPGLIFNYKENFGFIDCFINFLKHYNMMSDVISRCDYGSKPLSYLNQKMKFKSVKGGALITQGFLSELINDPLGINAIKFINTYDNIWEKYGTSTSVINLSIFHCADQFDKLIQNMSNARSSHKVFKKLN